MDVWNISFSSGFYMLRNHNGSIDMHIKLEFRHICLIDKRQAVVTNYIFD